MAPAGVYSNKFESWSGENANSFLKTRFRLTANLKTREVRFSKANGFDLFHGLNCCNERYLQY